ncbi:efflux RND transporter periplasmic adaptor subunit [Xanthocytophaga agilis]|uniref:Efflux RND transporter periplasmic adaptor subunit n=1 Tax=Xanthocytophaga agilis TaxID=3048010 RepID=A0AAE3UGQ9_9BACT|nr:efflux RND transporter periplasmic adaptor subunit [Xanthocytophaga agilis]MDJ1502712.1 efflux RND transporter periplasmic adaptor subunit [Xanthocytophaga agilis]
MAKKKTNRLLIILVSVVVLLLVFAFVGKKAGWIGKEKPTEVELAKAKKTEIIEKVSASGKVQPEVEVKISPDVSGEIIELPVNEGDSVVKGQLLVRIRPDNYISAVDRARATVNNNKASLAQSNVQLSRAKVQLAQAEIEYKRNKGLFEQNVISNTDWVTAETNYKAAVEDVKAAEEQISAARYLVQSAEAGLRDAQENLRKTTIYAPVSGTISKLDVELGERVVGTSQMAGTEMLRIANLNNMEVQADVNENDIVRVHLGDTAIIEVDSYTSLKKKFKGIVTEIANTANGMASSTTQSTSTDAVTEFQVKVRILQESYKELVSTKSKLSPFRPGMTASVEILTARKSGVLSVPLAAVTTRTPDGKAAPSTASNNDNNNNNTETTPKPAATQELKEVVFVNNNGKAELKEVKTGISDYDNIEIVSGLKEGDEVVSGPYNVIAKKLNANDLIATKKEEKDPKKK